MLARVERCVPFLPVVKPVPHLPSHSRLPPEPLNALQTRPVDCQADAAALISKAVPTQKSPRITHEKSITLSVARDVDRRM